MSLPQQPIPPVPAATAYFAQLAFPAGNGSRQMRDELGSIYDDELFATLYAAEGQPAVHPWRLAEVACDAGGSRISVTGRQQQRCGLELTGNLR